MKELVEYMARAIASDPDSVVVTEVVEDERTVFLGQSVAFSGNAIYNTLKTIPDERKI